MFTGLLKVKKDKTVLIVNGFDRISGPASFESAADSLAGFLYAVDRGVPYLNDIAFIGDQFEFRRSATWNSNDNNGHGDSYNNYAGQVIAGNTFDYPFIHGRPWPKPVIPLFHVAINLWPRES